MSTKIDIHEIEDPILEFGGVISTSDPKVGLKHAGPFDLRFGNARKDNIRLGFIGTCDSINTARNWIERCLGNIESKMTNKAQYPAFPGFKEVFRTEIRVNERWEYIIDQNDIQRIIDQKSTEAFKTAIEAWDKGLNELKKLELNKPDVVICCLPDEIVEKCWSIKNTIVKKKDLKRVNKLTNQLTLDFGGSDSIENVVEQQEDILNRDFRKALKAKAIYHQIPIQIGTTKLFTDSDKNQDASIRAWNSCIALYYKAGGIPWRIKTSDIETCFVGISFHHLYTTLKKHLVRSCIAQAFSSDGEGFAIRGVNIPWTDDQGMEVHLTEEQAYDLGEKILKEYSFRKGGTPLRIVLHKTTAFNEAEETGLNRALNNVPIIELINIAPTDFRLIKFGEYPPKRGTLCIVNSDTYFLFTSGFMPMINTYPGPHIPVPIQIKANRDIDIIQTAIDIIALTRMNWNTSSITGSQPVTLKFARMVGGIMSEYGEDAPPTSFRYYL